MSIPSICPLCAADARELYVKTAHVHGSDEPRAFFECGLCDVNFLYPQLSLEDQARFYAEEFDSYMAVRAGTSDSLRGAEAHMAANQEQRERRLPFLEPHLPDNGGRILEIGCSSGFMLLPLKDAGFEAHGIEPSNQFSGHLEKNGITVWKDLDEVAAAKGEGQEFDLIMHFFVLEHVSRPVEFIRSQLSLLKPNGKLVVEIPNANDALVTVFDVPEFEKFYWSVMHNWYFTERAFRNFLGQFDAPFEIQRDQRYDLSNHMTWALEGRPGGMSRFTELLGEPIEDKYRSALIESGYCDTLIGVLEKP